MTACSAKVNENNQWFGTPLPGRLDDVFGLKTNAFYHAEAPLVIQLNDHSILLPNDFYEVLEPSTAKVIARMTNVEGVPPAITVNSFGAGQAIYVATPAQPPIMQALYRSLYESRGIVPGPKTPAGVYARVVDGRTLYVNTTKEAQKVSIDGSMSGVLTGKSWSGNLQLGPYGVELLEKEN